MFLLYISILVFFWLFEGFFDWIRDLVFVCLFMYIFKGFFWCWWVDKICCWILFMLFWKFEDFCFLICMYVCLLFFCKRVLMVMFLFNILVFIFLWDELVVNVFWMDIVVFWLLEICKIWFGVVIFCWVWEEMLEYVILFWFIWLGKDCNKRIFFSNIAVGELLCIIWEELEFCCWIWFVDDWRFW